MFVKIKCCLFLYILLLSFSNSVSQPYVGIEIYQEQYKLPELPYDSAALESWMDNLTVVIHYGKHHRGYTNKLNAALKQWRDKNVKCDCRSFSILDMLKDIDNIPPEFQTDIKNNGGGFVNHNFFWAVMSPNSGTERKPTGSLLSDIYTYFTSYEKFKREFTAKALTVFGSGYAWLCRDEYDALAIVTTANQDCPITYKLHPLLVIDVWEHAYYLKHQNRRADFINDWWMLVDWQKVTDLDKWWKTISPRAPKVKREL